MDWANSILHDVLHHFVFADASLLSPEQRCICRLVCRDWRRLTPLPPIAFDRHDIFKFPSFINVLKNATQADISTHSLRLQPLVDLLNVIAIHTSLHTLSLGFWKVSPPLATAIGQMIQNNSSILNLSLSAGNTGSFAPIMQSINFNSKLQDLTLSLRISDVDAQELAESFKSNFSITSLSLAGNEISEGIYALSDMLKVNTTLRNLDLKRNKICAGVEALAASLAVNSTLQSLDLSSNGLSDDSIPFLAQLLRQNQSLTKIDFGSFNSVQNLSLLDSVLLHTNLHRLDLRKLQISLETARKIADFLPKFPALEMISIAECRLDTHVSSKIISSIILNRALRDVNLSHNQIDPNSLCELILMHPSIYRLNLGSTNITETSAARILACVAENSSIQILNLTANPLGLQGGLAIAQLLKQNKFAPKKSILRELTVNDCDLPSKSLEQIANSLEFNSRLQWLSLRGNDSTSNDMCYFARALRYNRALQLIVFDFQLDDSFAATFSESLRLNSTLTYADISNNQFSSNGKSFIAEILGGTSVELDFEFESIAAPELARALKLNPMRKIDRMFENLTSEHATQLVEALSTSFVCRTIFLANGFLGDEGALNIASILSQNRTIRSLTITNHQIGEAGCLHFSRMLKHNSSLKYLDLSRNSIGNAGVAFLAEGLAQNGSLTSFKLGKCSIKDDGAQTLASLIKSSLTIRHLLLEANEIGDAGAEALLDAISTDVPLARLVLRSNPLISTQMVRKIKIKAIEAQNDAVSILI